VEKNGCILSVEKKKHWRLDVGCERTKKVVEIGFLVGFHPAVFSFLDSGLVFLVVLRASELGRFVPCFIPFSCLL
jgi:hypothetical protein